MFGKKRLQIWLNSGFGKTWTVQQKFWWLPFWWGCGRDFDTYEEALDAKNKMEGQ
jgi:hypothetical protein